MFTKYTSIENSYRTEFLNRIKAHDYWDALYVVQEKAHGSNLSFWTENGQEFYAAKRSGLLASDESFYNHQLLLERHQASFKSIYQSIKVDYPDIKSMGIYGEVIGGSYAHKEVARTKNAIKVQKGIYYCPSNAFYAFDIKINGQQYLPIDYINQLFEENDLLFARTLFEGTLEACLEYPNLFDSTIPNILGLPSISPNTCEGVVIKSKEQLLFRNGSRVILKNKNDQWSERIKVDRSAKKEIQLPEQVVELQTAISSYVNENRLNNVLSKIGEVTIEDFGLVIGSFNKDVLEDFMKDYGAELAALDKKDRKLVTKSIGPSSARLIRSFFKQTVY